MCCFAIWLCHLLLSPNGQPVGSPWGLQVSSLSIMQPLCHPTSSPLHCPTTPPSYYPTASPFHHLIIPLPYHPTTCLPPTCSTTSSTSPAQTPHKSRDHPQHGLPSPSPSPGRKAIIGARHPIWSRSSPANSEMSLMETSMFYFEGLLSLPPSRSDNHFAERLQGSPSHPSAVAAL